MSYPADLKYRDSHEWIRIEDGVATVGISNHAQDQLGDVVYVDMPEVDAEVSAGESVAEIESVKAVSDIYAPVSGTISAVNEDLDGSEDSVNTDPYGSGWLFKIKMSNPADADALMGADAYKVHVES